MRFEDFGAQEPRGVPRRVNEADVYLLLLGAHYGAETEDALVSPAEEEF